MSENNGSTGNKKFLKGTLILTASSMVVKVIGSVNWIILSRILGGEGISGRRRHRAVPDGLSDLFNGDNGIVGRHTGGNFHHHGRKSGGKRLFWRQNGV